MLQRGLPAEVIIEGVQAEVQTGFLRALLKLLPAVHLPAQKHFQVPQGQAEGIVQHHFIVPHLLERERRRIAKVVALPFYHAGRKVEIAEPKPGIAPGAVFAHQSLGSPLPETGVGHRAVPCIFIGTGIFVRETGAPDPAAQVAVRGKRISSQAVVRLVFRGHTAPHRTRHPDGFRMEDNNAGEGV